MDGDGALVVICGGEHLRCLGGDGGVLLDQLGHHTAHGFDTQRQRRHVEQQHILHFALQHTALNRGTDGYRFIRVHVAARFLAKKFFHSFLHQRHAGLATDQNHITNIRGADARILHRNLARLDGARDQVFDQTLQFGTGDFHGQMFRAAGVSGDVRQVHFGLLRAGQFDLGFFRRIFQALQRQHIFAQVDAAFLFEFIDQIVDHAHIEIFAAQEGVAVCGQHFELVLALDLGDVDDGNIEGAAAQVIHRDLAVAFLLVQTESQRGCGRLVDDAFHFQTRDAPGILGGLALCIVEISRNGDDRFGDGFTEIVFGSLLHFHQHLRGNFRCGKFLVAYFHPCVAVLGLDDFEWHHGDVFLHHFLVETAADQALYAIQRVGRIGHGLTFGGRTHQHFTVFHIGDDRRGSTCAFRVLDHLGLAVFHDGHARVGRAQVDTDDFSHDDFPFS